MVPFKFIVPAILAIVSLAGCAATANSDLADFKQERAANEQRILRDHLWDGLELPAG